MKIGIIITTYEEHHNIKNILCIQKNKNIQFFFCFVDGSYTNKTS